MTTGRVFSISEFAKLSRTTRATLHYYDKIGLLSPMSRGDDNNYRYYSTEQLAIVNVIRTLQESGMSLTDIAGLKERRTPELMDETLMDQLNLIDEKIEGLFDVRKLLRTLRESIHSARNVDEREIEIRFLPEESIILGEPNDYEGGKSDFDALRRFYRDANARYLNLNANYPVWAVFSEERVKRGDWTFPDRYYFHNPDGRDKRPTAHYAIGYARGGYGQNDGLYRRLIEYIDRNGFEICGNAYEEYPLNEICVADDRNYLMRIMIAVRGPGEK